MDPYMTYHGINYKLGMNCSCFKFLWRHFHINEPKEDDDLEGDKGSNDSGDNYKEGLGLTFDQVQCKQQNNNEDPKDEEVDEDEESFQKKKFGIPK